MGLEYAPPPSERAPELAGAEGHARAARAAASPAGVVDAVAAAGGWAGAAAAAQSLHHAGARWSVLGSWGKTMRDAAYK